ncbi:MAG: hypothetical protein WEE89_21595 [Gemmatimonadota bacterium]
MSWKPVNNAIRSLPALLLVIACSQDAPDDASTADTPPVSTQSDATDRVAVAMSAAPASISSGATIMDFDSTGKLVQLRAGTNGWLCLADDTPAAPGDSPDCVDQRWQAWFEAYEQKKVPRISGVGVAYMLQGSLTPSNADPFAQTPAPGADWIKDGPHVMVIVPDPAMLVAFPSDHMTGGPYVMYKGTPYAHLMVPVSVK